MHVGSQLILICVRQIPSKSDNLQAGSARADDSFLSFNWSCVKTARHWKRNNSRRKNTKAINRECTKYSYVLAKSILLLLSSVVFVLR